jgi:hypothetical protein
MPTLVARHLNWTLSKRSQAERRTGGALHPIQSLLRGIRGIEASWVSRDPSLPRASGRHRSVHVQRAGALREQRFPSRTPVKTAIANVRPGADCPHSSGDVTVQRTIATAGPTACDAKRVNMPGSGPPRRYEPRISKCKTGVTLHKMRDGAGIGLRQIKQLREWIQAGRCQRRIIAAKSDKSTTAPPADMIEPMSARVGCSRKKRGTCAIGFMSIDLFNIMRNSRRAFLPSASNDMA